MKCIRYLESGYMLLEVLVTVGILAVGLLGVAAMQVNALKFGVSAVQRGEVAILVAAMSDRMRANTAAVYANAYHNKNGDKNTNTTNFNAVASTNSQRADYDFLAWMRDINNTFDGSSEPQASIDCSNNPNCIIEISWIDNRAKTDLNNAGLPPRDRHIVSVVF